MSDIVYEEQKQLIKMWKDKYYKKKEEIERLTISLQAQEELTMNEHIKVEKLRSIIKEARKYIEDNTWHSMKDILEILEGGK